MDVDARVPENEIGQWSDDRYKQSYKVPPGPGELCETDASLRDCTRDLLRERPGTVGERVAIARLRFVLKKEALNEPT